MATQDRAKAPCAGDVASPRAGPSGWWHAFWNAFARRGLGARGESLAAAHLRKQGYEILAHNFRVRGGEADLIARSADRIVVVEVKARRSLRFGAPQEAIDRRKTRRVLRAGRAYCRAHGLSLALLRGDVIAVEWPAGGGAPVVTHWKGVLGD